MNRQHVNTIRTLLNTRPAGELQVFEALEEVLDECLKEAIATAAKENGAGESAPAKTPALIMRAHWEPPVLSFTYRSGSAVTAYHHCRLDLDTGSVDRTPIPLGRSWVTVLLLVRHAKYEPYPDPAKPGEFLHGRPHRLSEAGQKETNDVGGVLASIAHDGVETTTVEITDFRYAPSWEARETSTMLLSCFGSETPLRAERCRDLDPGHTYLYPGTKELDELIARLARFASPSPSVLAQPNDEAYRFFTKDKAYATVVVGHLPMLSWLARRITGKAIPIQHSEVLCIELPRQPALRRARRGLFSANGRFQWVLSPSDPEAITDLREKIKSKMDTAKALSVFIAAGFGFVLKAISDLPANAPDHQFWGYRVTALFFFLSIMLYLVSMYSYDSLLMPKRFWADASPGALKRRPRWVVSRPPSPAHWLLYQNMINVWSRQFTPATVCFMLGLLSLAFSVLSPSDWIWPAVVCLTLGVMLVAFVINGAPLLIKRLIGPWLGSED
jgi:hypothetical protein